MLSAPTTGGWGMQTTTYSRHYVDATRARVEAQVASFRGFAAAATTPDAAVAVEAWAPIYFASLVVGLDHAFVHRGRAGGDGADVLDEVRLIATAIEAHDAVMTVDPAIGYDPARAVLGLRPGAPIELDDVAFERLADAYLSEIAARFTI